jgi:diamine N-acetyltransferase
MIKGSKITLLAFDERHLACVHAWINDEDLRRGIGTEGPVSEFEHRRWYEQVMSDPLQRMFIIGQGIGLDAKPVGLIGLRNIEWRSRVAEFWIYLGESSVRGQGIATEASNLLLRFGFNTLGLNRIFLLVNDTNSHAIELYRRLGFVKEGICRQSAFQDGCFVDRIQFSILAVEHLQRQQSK